MEYSLICNEYEGFHMELVKNLYLARLEIQQIRKRFCCITLRAQNIEKLVDGT